MGTFHFLVMLIILFCFAILNSVSREKELARIVIKKEDVDLIVSTIYTVNLSLFNFSITQLVDLCKSCILIGYATRGLIVIVIE